MAKRKERETVQKIEDTWADKIGDLIPETVQAWIGNTFAVGFVAWMLWGAGIDTIVEGIGGLILFWVVFCLLAWLCIYALPNFYKKFRNPED
tara:strand:+ start:360 stop:635 length:276 start_codon:yes stop_codon:yes gene_type:complete